MKIYCVFLLFWYTLVFGASLFGPVVPYMPSDAAQDLLALIPICGRVLEWW